MSLSTPLTNSTTTPLRRTSKRTPRLTKPAGESGAWLKSWREEHVDVNGRPLTRYKLSVWLGVPGSTVYRWEAGEMAIDNVHLIKLALEHYDCTFLARLGELALPAGRKHMVARQVGLME